MNLLKSVFNGTVFLLPLLLSAQSNKLQIEAELRPRILLDNGYKTPQIKDNETPVYTTQRTRLNILFINDKSETYISLQDVRIWGADDNYKSSGNYGNTKSLCLYQGWVKLKLNEGVSLKVGKQSFSYDDQRIMSARNWNDYQVTYDAMLSEFTKNKHRLHLGLSYNADNKSNLLYPDEEFKTFNFVHYRYKAEKLTLSTVAVLTGNTLTDTTKQVFYRATYGANANYKANKTDVRLSAYYQHNLNDIRGKISAFCLSAYAEQKLANKLKLGIGYDFLSGNDENSNSLTNKRFDILYGRRHGWYGYMDYFSTTPEQGLQDLMAKLIYKPTKKIDIQLHGHYFMLAADMYYNSNEKLSKQLGKELDLKMNYKFNEAATLECGYSRYATSSTLKKLKKVDRETIKTPQFCYIMLTFKPSFFF